MSLISPQDIWYPTNSMVDWSTLDSGSYMLPWWPQWTIHSTSFHPLLAACRNISCRIIALCVVPSSHLGYLSKKSPISIWHSTSLMEISSSSAQSWAALVLCNLSPYLNDNRVCITEDIMKMYLYIAAKTFNHAFYTKLPMRYDSQIFCFTMLFLDNSLILQHHLYISGKS